MKGVDQLKKVALKWMRSDNLRHVSVLLIFLIFSKGLGFLRQILIYQRMDSVCSDLLFAALKIPNAITTLLLTGTVITSILPVLSRLESRSLSDQNGEKSTSEYLNLVLGILCGVIVILDVLILLFTRQFLELTTSQQIMQNFANKGLLDDYVKITQIMLLFPLGLAVQSIFGVFLTLKKRFFVYSWAGIIYNAGTILGILLSGYNGLYQVAWGMILGMWATVLVYAVSSYQAGLKLVWTWGSTSKLWQNCQQDLVDTWKTFIPRIFVFNGVLTAGFLINLIATNNGQITYFDIGLSIQEVFLTISSSIATVFFPDLAKLWNRADLDREVFWNKLNKYVRIVTLVSMGGVVVTLILSPVVVRIFEILGKGQNNGDYIIMIARFSTLSLVFQSVNEILSKYFYVRERVWQPVILSLGGSVAQILLTMSLLLTGLDAGIITCLGLAANNLVIWLWSFYLIHQDRKVS